jgi:hypothetical protein
MVTPPPEVTLVRQMSDGDGAATISVNMLDGSKLTGIRAGTAVNEVVALLLESYGAAHRQAFNSNEVDYTIFQPGHEDALTNGVALGSDVFAVVSETRHCLPDCLAVLQPADILSARREERARRKASAELVPEYLEEEEDESDASDEEDYSNDLLNRVRHFNCGGSHSCSMPWLDLGKIHERYDAEIERCIASGSELLFLSSWQSLNNQRHRLYSGTRCCPRQFAGTTRARTRVLTTARRCASTTESGCGARAVGASRGRSTASAAASATAACC